MIKEPVIFQGEKFVELMEKFPVGSHAFINFSAIAENEKSAENAETISDLLYCTNFLIPDRTKLNTQNSGILVFRDDLNRIGLFLTNTKISKQELVSMPWGLLAGKDPLIGVGQEGDNSPMLYICQGNSISIPVCVPMSEISQEESILLSKMVETVVALDGEYYITTPIVY